MADTMDKSNLASMLRDYEKGIVNASPLSRAIGEQARQAVGAVSQLREGAGGGPFMGAPTGKEAEPPTAPTTKEEWEYATRNFNLENAPNFALDAMGVANLIGKGNPYTLAATTARDAYKWNERYNNQRVSDEVNFGIGSNPLLTILRTAPLGIGELMRYFGPQPGKRYPMAFKAHLANRGVDLGGYEGPPVVGPPPIAPVERGILAAPPGAKAAPWVNPNLPPTQHSFDNWGYTEDTGTTSTGETYDWGDFYAKGGIASLIA